MVPNPNFECVTMTLTSTDNRLGEADPIDNSVGPATDGGIPNASHSAVKHGRNRSSATMQTVHSVTDARRAGSKRPFHAM